ncbi:MAG: GGDEF domain-containing protein [Treponema sp.]|jgi:diguanylate cyclase (GGDEF)-like protein|nr:GGDEF domain-containing protein [Treponema sp.]
MNKPANYRKDFFSSPKVREHYNILQEVGIFTYIESLDQEIINYKNLFDGALDIVNRVNINDIMDAAVWQISDRFLPTSIVFLWKPLQNREDITIKCYKNYQLADVNVIVNNISAFEPFFNKHPEPVSYKLFSSEFGQSKTIKSFDTLEPELVIPILGPLGLYGLVLVGRNILGADYNQLELMYIQSLMSFVSKAIQNHLHYERTLRDIKTGLYNSGFFMARLNEEIIRSKRSSSETSIIIMDVDHFKNFNDKYGHIAGDRVLESLAITIKQGVRLGDIPSRFGGEEFTVLLPDTGKEMAFGIAERVRTLVETMKVTWEPPLPKVTISLGVYSFDKSTNIPADEIINRADEALYLSKAMGRNRTTAWGTGLLDKIERQKSQQENQNHTA